MKKCNNAGFSLVELIVTILIMSILAAGVVVSVVAMHRADSDKEANKIATILSKGRQQTLSREGETYVCLYADATGQYIYWENIRQVTDAHGNVQDISETEKQKLDDKAVITVAKMNGAVVEETILEPGGSIKIDFSKSSGAFKSGAPLYIKVTADKDLFVCLVQDTGRCYIDTTY